MPTKLSPSDLTDRIQELLDERQEHLDAVASIEQTLERVGSALWTTTSQPERGTASAMPAAPGRPGRKKGGRRHRGTFAVTGEESILNFVKENKNPTNRAIEQHWKQEGRGGAAANTLTKLVKDGRLKREPLEGQRGSRYLVG